MRTIPASSSAPSASPAKCWRNASRWAAPSPASTAWAWRRSTRCACSSARTRSPLSRRWSALSNPQGSSIPAITSRRLTAAPSGRTTPDCPGDVPPYHGVRITPEFSWGLGNDFDWGLYLPTTSDAQGHFHPGGAKLRAKWLPVHGAEGRGGWYFGINNELSDLTRSFSDSRWNDEVRIIGGHRRPDWLVGRTPILRLC